MSKIIKACFVKQESLDMAKFPQPYQPQSYQPPYEQVLPKKKSQAELTKDTAESIYLETKTMIDELVTAAQKKAEGILAEAEKKAARKIQESQLEYEKIIKEASEKGFNSGYQEGMKKAQEETEHIMEQVKALIIELKNNKQDFIQTNMEEIIDLVMVISEKILQTIVECKPEVISAIVKNVFETVAEADSVIVKVNPVHLPYLDLFSGTIKETLIDKVKVEGDATIKPGSCILVTEQGFIDGQIEQQLLILKKALKEDIEYA